MSDRAGLCFWSSWILLRISDWRLGMFLEGWNLEFGIGRGQKSGIGRVLKVCGEVLQQLYSSLEGLDVSSRHLIFPFCCQDNRQS